jgi:hypothetical protein
VKTRLPMLRRLGAAAVVIGAAIGLGRPAGALGMSIFNDVFGDLYYLRDHGAEASPQLAQCVVALATLILGLIALVGSAPRPPSSLAILGLVLLAAEYWEISLAEKAYLDPDRWMVVPGYVVIAGGGLAAISEGLLRRAVSPHRR